MSEPKADLNTYSRRLSGGAGSEIYSLKVLSSALRSLGRALGLVVWLGTLSLAACASENVTHAGSQSNWLACEHGDGCPKDLQCQCGLCTRTCDLSSGCSDLHAHASCEATSSLQPVCQAALPSKSRLCVLTCVTDRDCGDSASGLSCRGGFCIATASATTNDAAIPDASSSGDDGGAAAPIKSDVEVVITADNAYGFGYGTDASLRNYFGGVSNSLAQDIFSCGPGPETYTVPAAAAQPGDTLYIIAWADAATTQGVLGQFRRGTQTVYTGQGNWTVCATGVRYDPSTSSGPDIVEINRQIGLCNTGTTDPATTSAGWVDSTGNGAGALAIGEDNSTARDPAPVSGNEFPIACGIGAAAHWMWFNWDPKNIKWPAQTPFIWPSAAAASDNPDKQFLIFRLGAGEVRGPS